LNTSDEQLVASIQSTGSQRDLEELVERYLPTVRKLAYRVLLRDDEADDVTQEVFMSVVKNLNHFRGESQFSTWLYRITMNAAKNYHCRKRKLRTVLALPGDSLVENQEVLDHRSDARPDRKVLSDELANEIKQALEQLSPKLRSAIVLTSLEQLSPKAAAAIEGCTTTTIHWRVHQARKQLKKSLREYLQP
jgi:RNA polymerase sigma-70 factor (ECF subfamily)